MQKALGSLFEGHFGEPVRSVVTLKGDGSCRQLFRLKGDSRTAIGAIGPDHKENRAFLEFSRHFRLCGLPVPEIFAEDPEKGLYLEEDLGDTTLFDFISAHRTREDFPKEVVENYRRVIRTLPSFQVEGGRTLEYRFCYPRACFDKQSMKWDLNYFKYYFLRLAQIPFDEQALEDDFEHLAEFLLGAARNYFLYRDFQSRNVMLRNGEPWFIDYQGGRRGALQYDVASMLFDAKADIPFPVRDLLLDEYLAALAKLIPVRRAEFMRHYHGYVYIRIVQALGSYGLRGFYERKTHFLQSIPYAIRNLEHLMRTAELPVELPALIKVFQHMVGSSYLRQFGGAELKLTVRVLSFSYRRGIPADETGHGGGFVFDCRALPNPGKEERFARLTGRDIEVAAFLESSSEVRRFLEHVFLLVEQSTESYRSRNFTDLMVAFGCTGGQHRSVYCAEMLARRLREQGVQVELCHAELSAGSNRESTP
ncbi:MAG: Phosphotransferase enzyme family protein [Acidobacteria bacterium]|nr:Phosphotransferase enzyme family protein [Acidobacteriota bacterium]